MKSSPCWLNQKLGNSASGALGEATNFWPLKQFEASPRRISGRGNVKKCDKRACTFPGISDILGDQWIYCKFRNSRCNFSYTGDVGFAYSDRGVT